ncbi:MAG: hypothetical protein H6Q05_2005 [Acidobacteria bacterium]|nr:hypothetical protein [Acidobacteriota bacterium]
MQAVIIIGSESNTPRFNPQLSPQMSLHLEGKESISPSLSSRICLKQNSFCGDREDGRDGTNRLDRACTLVFR